MAREEFPWYVSAVAQPNPVSRQQAVSRQEDLTKPPGSLGRLEMLAIELAAMQGVSRPEARPCEIAIFAGDHGVARENVSAFPQEVTAQMVLNFVNGGAAISVLAKRIGAGLTVINAGTAHQGSFPSPVIDSPVGHGTGNIAVERAMSQVDCVASLELGRRVANGFPAQTRIAIGGEMGIANTTSATALAAAFGVATAAELVGPGTGLDSAGVQHKLRVVERALDRAGNQVYPLRILAEFGGYEIVALVGFFIAIASRNMAILVDGFIASVAALAACRINPYVRDWMLFSHTSAEPGHVRVLESLNAVPLLQFDMRLGEGSGAASAVPLLDIACALHSQMATFSEAGVSDG